MVFSLGSSSGLSYQQMAQQANDTAAISNKYNSNGNLAGAADFSEESAKYNNQAATEASKEGNSEASQTLYAKSGTNYAIASAKEFTVAKQLAAVGDKAGASEHMKKAKEDINLSKQAFKEGAKLGGPMQKSMQQMYNDASIMASQTKSKINPSASYLQAGVQMNDLMQRVKAQQPATLSDLNQTPASQQVPAIANQTAILNAQMPVTPKL